MKIHDQTDALLKKDCKRISGREAWFKNINSAIEVAQFLRTTLGPYGLDKMIVDVAGDITISKDGCVILDELELVNPVAKLLFEAARGLDKEVGDGTTTLIIIIGELLNNALKLFSNGVHPNNVIEGYQDAATKAIEIADIIALPVNPLEKNVLKKVALTSMAGRLIEELVGEISDMIVTAALKVTSKERDGYHVNLDDIKIEWKYGSGMMATEFIDGVLLDRGVAHPTMPKIIKNAKIILLRCGLEYKKLKINHKIYIDEHRKIMEVRDEKLTFLENIIKRIKEVGANVVICEKDIDQLARYLLAREKILAVANIWKWDIERLSKATGAKILTSFEFISENDVGYAGIVEEITIEREKWIAVHKCRNPKAVSILVRASYRKLAEEGKETLKDGLSSVRNVIEEPMIVGGGGSFEVELALRLKKWAYSIPGKKQLAINAFANALENIPLTLAENAGMDALKILLELRHRHANGEMGVGIDAFNLKLSDALKVGIIEPLRMKKQILKTSNETVSAILKINDVFFAPKFKPALPQRPFGTSLSDYTKIVDRELRNFKK